MKKIIQVENLTKVSPADKGQHPLRAVDGIEFILDLITPVRHIE